MGSSQSTGHETVGQDGAAAGPARRRRPMSGAETRVQTPREAASRLPVEFFAYFDALEELIFASSYRDEPCVALMDGELGLDEDGTFVELTGFSDLQYTADDRTMHLPLRNALDARFDHDAGNSDPLEVAGFFVGLPGSGGKLTEPIARVHLSLFNVPYQVALVADPVQRRVGLYARNEAGRFVNATFRVVYKA